MNNQHTYTVDEMRNMRDIAFMMAQLLYTKHVPNAEQDERYWIDTLQYAESIIQTHIAANMSLDDLKELYYHIKEA